MKRKLGVKNFKRVRDAQGMNGWIIIIGWSERIENNQTRELLFSCSLVDSSYNSLCTSCILRVDTSAVCCYQLQNEISNFLFLPFFSPKSYDPLVKKEEKISKGDTERERTSKNDPETNHSHKSLCDASFCKGCKG